jgi:hypothetical protein
MKCAVVLGSVAIMDRPRFMKTGLDIQKLIRTDTQTHGTETA